MDRKEFEREVDLLTLYDTRKKVWTSRRLRSFTPLLSEGLENLVQFGEDVKHNDEKQIRLS